jgi:Domain of unknown function (DUF4184)
MPFTVAHAAAALPFRKFNLAWSAFLVGSMAPDFPYVVGNIRYRALGHAFPGVLLFMLPASFAALWFYHRAIKRPIAGLLPIGMQQRLNDELGEFTFGGTRRFLAITFSIILAIATHLLWDSFTHSRTWPWLYFTRLQSWIDVPLVGWTPMIMILQYASTLPGILALAVWMLLWYRDTPPVTEAGSLPHQFRIALTVLMFAIALAAGLWRAWMLPGMIPGTIHHWDRFLLHFSVTTMAVAFWELLFYSLLTTSREYASRRRSSA